MAEVAAAKKKAEFDRIIAVRQNERKLFEAEEELRLRRRRAQHEVEMAIFVTEKAEAIQGRIQTDATNANASVRISR